MPPKWMPFSKDFLILFVETKPMPPNDTMPFSKMPSKDVQRETSHVEPKTNAFHVKDVVNIFFV